MWRSAKIGVGLAAAAMLAIALAVGQPKADKALQSNDKTQQSPAQMLAMRYGDKVVEHVIKSAEARGWKRTDQVYAFGRPLPTRSQSPIRTVQDYEYGDGGGWIRVWAWEDGDDVNTIEGTVEIGKNSTGQRVVFNIQLYTPNGDSTQATEAWSDVIYADAGPNPNASVPLSARPRAPGIVAVQGQYCHMPNGLADQLVFDCQARNAGRYFRTSWRNSWTVGGGAAAVICRRGSIRERILCAVEAVGAVFAGELLKNFNDPPDGMIENCDREALKRKWCLENGDYYDCNPNSRAGC
jgi:hypothetical protein